MNYYYRGRHSGCGWNYPRPQGMGLSAARSNPMPVLQTPVYMSPAFVPAMALMDEDQLQPSDGKVAVTPTNTEEPETTEPSLPAELDAFLAQNPKKGKLRIQAFRGQQILPVAGVHVVVSRMFDNQKYIFFEGDTDQSGIIDGIILPAAPRDRSLDPGEPLPSATYDLMATYPRYQALQTTVDIYQDIKTTQMIQMLLRVEA